MELQEPIQNWTNQPHLDVPPQKRSKEVPKDPQKGSKMTPKWPKMAKTAKMTKTAITQGNLLSRPSKTHVRAIKGVVIKGVEPKDLRQGPIMGLSRSYIGDTWVLTVLTKNTLLGQNGQK